MKWPLVFGIAVSTFCVSASASAADWYVDDDGAILASDGLTPETAFRFLRDAFAAASDGDTIHIGEGTVELSSAYGIPHDLKFVGEGIGVSNLMFTPGATLDGVEIRPGHGMEVSNMSVTVEGGAGSSGFVVFGSALGDRASFSAADVEFRGFRTPVWGHRADVTFERVTVDGHIDMVGGSVFHANDSLFDDAYVTGLASNLRIVDSVLLETSVGAHYGRIRLNRVHSIGDGVHGHDANVRVLNSVFQDPGPRPLDFWGGTAEVVHNTFLRTTPGGEFLTCGGDVYVGSGFVLLQNNAVRGFSSLGSIDTARCGVSPSNNAFYNPTGAFAHPFFASYNLVDTPFMVDLNTFRPAPVSPLMYAAGRPVNTTGLTTDFHGVSRRWPATIGAVEGHDPRAGSELICHIGGDCK